MIGRRLGLASLLLLGACAQNNVLTGTLQTAEGTAGAIVPITVDQPAFEAPVARAVLPDGERFTGSILQQSQFVDPGPGFGFGPSWGPYRPYWGGYPWGGGPYYVRGGTADGLLTGDRGHTMECHLTLAGPGAGLSGGGFGNCTVSDGRKLVVRF